MKNKLVVFSLIICILTIIFIIFVSNYNVRVKDNNHLLSNKLKEIIIDDNISYYVLDNQEWFDEDETTNDIHVIFRFRASEGIEYIIGPNGNKIYGNGKTVISVDYSTPINTDLNFKLKIVRKNEVEKKITITENDVYNNFNVEFDYNGLKEIINTSINIYEYNSEIKYHYIINMEDNFEYYYKLYDGDNNWIRLNDANLYLKYAGILYFKKVDQYNNSIYLIKDSYSFKAEQNGYYEIECWGANGGYSIVDGGYGAAGGIGGYAKGKIYLNEGDKLFAYIGDKGMDAAVRRNSTGGYNGRRKWNMG